MHVVSVLGPEDAGRGEFVARLAERLGQQGAVATVSAPGDASADGGTLTAPDTEDAPSDHTAFRMDETGYSVSGERPTTWDLLERLAPDYDYAVFEGIDDDELPTVRLGNDADEREETPEDHLLVAPDGESVDLDALVDAIDDSEPFETLESLVARAKESPEAPKSGAIATFTGRVRAKEHDDDTPTEYLEFEQYDDVADDRFATIRAELEAREGVFEVIMHHRTGILEYGKDIVFVVVLAGHRSEAFETVSDGIDRLKAEVPIFKKEVTVDEEFWAHEE